jgi:flavin-dependent dehydrogenase
VNRNFEIIVVGAGPAGAAAAALLARAGRRVALVDIAHFPRQKVCGEYLSAAAWELLEDMQLGPTRAMGVELTRMRLDTPRGRGVGAEYDFEPERRPAALSRWKLDAMLVGTACAAGAELFCGYRVRSVRRDAGRVTGVICSAVNDAEEQLELDAPLVVAADGRRSRVVQETGRRTIRSSGVVGFKRHVRPRDMKSYEGVLSMYAEPGGYVGVCPTELGTLNVCGLIPRARLQAAHGDFSRAMRDWIGPTSPLRSLVEMPAEQEEAWHTMPDVARQRAQPEIEGVVYVGDALGTIEPLAGQGMTMALAGARLLVRFLLTADGRPIGRAEQRRYDATWHATFDRRITDAARFGDLLRRPRVLAAAIAGCDLIPGLASSLMKKAYGRVAAL